MTNPVIDSLSSSFEQLRTTAQGVVAKNIANDPKDKVEAAMARHQQVLDDEVRPRLEALAAVEQRLTTELKKTNQKVAEAAQRSALHEDSAGPLVNDNGSMLSSLSALLRDLIRLINPNVKFDKDNNPVSKAGDSATLF